MTPNISNIKCIFKRDVSRKRMQSMLANPNFLRHRPFSVPAAPNRKSLLSLKNSKQNPKTSYSASPRTAEILRSLFMFSVSFQFTNKSQSNGVKSKCPRRFHNIEKLYFFISGCLYHPFRHYRGETARKRRRKRNPGRTGRTRDKKSKGNWHVTDMGI